MKFVIDRSMWSRGGEPATKLVREYDGRMCCLGFFLLACGIPREELLDRSEPDDVARRSPTRHTALRWGLPSPAPEGPPWAPERWPSEAQFLLRNMNPHLRAEGDAPDWTTSNAAQELITVNDDASPEVTETDREAEIARLFAEHDVQVTFVDSLRGGT